MSIRTTSGFAYMVHPSVQERVVEGLAAADNIRVTDFIGTATINPTYFFHIEEGNDVFALIVSEEYPAPLCNCETNVLPCKHAFWLIDQIFYTAAQALPESYFPREIHLAENGTATWPVQMHMELPSTADLIYNIGSLRFRELRGWNLRRQHSPDDDGTGQIANQGGERLEDKFGLLCWVLTPNDAIKEQFDLSVKRRSNDDQDEVLEPVLEGFKELVRSFMDNNDMFRTRLNALLTPDFTTSAQLIQLKCQYEATRREFDALRNPFNTLDRWHSFIQCVERFREHDNDIARLYDGGYVRKPEHIWYMAGLLLNILGAVVDRNYPAITDPGWVEDINDPTNNLYVSLILTPTAGEQRMFVLGTLERIQTRILVSHRSTMSQILGRVQHVEANERLISILMNRLREVDAVIED